jgi:hypothetical protein
MQRILEKAEENTPGWRDRSNTEGLNDQQITVKQSTE